MSDGTPQAVTVLSLIRGIREGTVSGRQLDPSDRQRCVEHLSTEGYSAVEVSEILDVSERTVTRDRAAVRRSHALNRDAGLVAEMVGQLVQHAEGAIGRLRRLGRDGQTPPSVRVETERACWMIRNQLIERLQSLGYLPTAATEIRGELTHHVLPEFAQMQQEVQRLESVLTDEAERRELTEVRRLIDRGVVAERIETLSARRDTGRDPTCDERAD